MPACALGLRVHSGWAALVAVSPRRGVPEVVLRRRLEIADPAIEGSRQPYHEAEGMPLDRASRYLARCEAASRRLATAGLREASALLAHEGGRAAKSCGILLASGRALPDLAGILASHALIHTADGVHFRDALASASETLGLRVVRTREKEVAAEVAGRSGLSEREVSARVAALRKDLGPPWTADEKLATLAAWRALPGA